MKGVVVVRRIGEVECEGERLGWWQWKLEKG